VDDSGSSVKRVGKTNGGFGSGVDDIVFKSG
jgi:hypothetical protein